ncbi:type II toxin-antitoxin system RelE/ParE family toxin [Candidatus Woesearchaeota archaeon]|nr:type II toxin-antitoxin system RelE/ParE family toxin [Candidatus Woesearchaeota archaeon]
MFKLILSDKADKKLEKLKKRDKNNFEIIVKHLENLTQNPKFYGKLLTGDLAGLWSYRIADFRIVYEIEENRLIVFVIEIEHRKSVYDK